jgi:hypothetical protein
MEIFNGPAEAAIIFVVAVGGIFATLMLLHVITEVYKCSLKCVKERFIKLFKWW